MSNDAGGEKTEKATPKRMKELRRDGSLQRSQDLSAWVIVAAVVAVLPLTLRLASDSARVLLIHQPNYDLILRRIIVNIESHEL